MAEEGAVLLKNEHETLPVSARDLEQGIAISGPGAEYLVANPNNEGAAGFADRNAISPLQQLKLLSGTPAAFSYTPANSPTGQAVPCRFLSSAPARASAAAPADSLPPICDGRSGLQRSSGRAVDALVHEGVDHKVDFTKVSTDGQLTGGKVYRWDGWIYVPARDSYVFRLQYGSALAGSDVRFTLDDSRKTLVDADSFYHGSWYGGMALPVATTNDGYVEGGLRNQQCALPAEKKTRSPLIVGCEASPSVGWHRVSLQADATALASDATFSFRFAVSRSNGDIEDAASNAEGKALAIVFVDDEGRNTVPNMPALSSLSPVQQQLIKAIAAKNPNTVVVLNTGTPFIVKEWIDDPHVKAVLNMWQTGQEGGTATARLLLGQANPSGHTTVTWPRDNTDTVEGYNQLRGLYPGDTAGMHPERVNGGDYPSTQSQGIYSGYRYYDNLSVPVQFPFGFGLSYTTFKFADLKTKANDDGTEEVTFSVTNTGRVAGAVVPQIYVGPGPAVEHVQQAVRSLRGFERVYLDPAHKQQVVIKLDRRSFQYWSEPQQTWVTNYGPRTIFVGDADSPEALPLSATIQLSDHGK